MENQANCAAKPVQDLTSLLSDLLTLLATACAI